MRGIFIIKEQNIEYGVPLRRTTKANSLRRRYEEIRY